MIKNIFYRFYKFFEWTENNLTPESLRMPQYIAGFFFSILLLLNITALDVLLNTIYSRHFFLVSKSIVTIYVIVISIVLFFSFFYKKKYLQIAEKYKDEDEMNRNIGIALAISYIVFTIILLVIVVQYSSVAHK